LRDNEGDLEKKYRDEAYIMDIYYIFAAKFTIMDTATLNNIEKKKKLIELPNDVCHRLAVQAAIMGTSVKKLIESMVINATEESDDDALYSYLLRTRPDGNIMISDAEQKELLDRLKAKAETDEL
jgi:hypothetical protein